ncbi:MAG: phosphatase PAP2 family protein [Xanthobacteraceae bacterium]
MSAQLPKAPVNEDEAAWRFLLANWIIIGVMAAVLGASLFAADLSIQACGLILGVGYVGLYAGLAHADARSPLRRDPQLAFVLGGTAQILLTIAIMAPLTHPAAGMNFPLRHAAVFAGDRAFGFNGTNQAAFVDAHPALASWLDCGYAMTRWPFLVIPLILVVLAARQHYRRIEEFTFAFGAALAATTILSALALAPAIVILPNFQAAAALLYAWALWPLRRLRSFATLICGVMLAAAPANGAHGFVDLVGGLLVAIAAIAAARVIGRFLARREAGCIAAKAALAAVPPAPMPLGALAE